jgi:hypothetical protein
MAHFGGVLIGLSAPALVNALAPMLVHGFVHKLRFGSGRSGAHASFRGRPRDEVILRRGRLDSAGLGP